MALSDYPSLPAQVRADLDRFGNAFDRLDPVDYLHYALHAQPRTDQLEHLAWEGLRAAGMELDARAAVAAFEEAATRNAIERMGFRAAVASLPKDSFSYGPDEHQLLINSLRRAVLALIAAPQLDRDAFERLLGPWSRLTDRGGITSAE